MPTSQPLRVLIVDDEPDAADTLSLLVKAVGHTTRTAYSPAEADHVVRDGFHPDAILMDIGLPEMDGFAVARELCKALPTKPLLVAVTGYNFLDKRTQQEGFEVYFVKPVNPDLILEILEGHTERRSLPDPGA